MMASICKLLKCSFGLQIVLGEKERGIVVLKIAEIPLPGY
jgi:hypothetical protein